MVVVHRPAVPRGGRRDIDPAQNFKAETASRPCSAGFPPSCNTGGGDDRVPPPILNIKARFGGAGWCAGQKRHQISAAILDFRLGDATALPIAAQLRHHGVPFGFFTGQPNTRQIESACPDRDRTRS